jgi:peptidyl-prolyl cis-trans isomerase B (cyclophilin B)
VKLLSTAAVLAGVCLVVAGCVARESPSSERPTEDFSAPVQTETSGDCGFRLDESAAEKPAVGLPPDEGSVDAESLALTTSAGEITIALDAERAPCTVQSMAFLAGEGYFDGTQCHRITASEGLKVLQCGDPEGTGAGGPGYVIPDELPTDLPAGPALPDGSPSTIYQRGVVAMANAGPETGGSQFFLVYGDSTLPPAYSVFGTIDETGLATLDQIAAAGITPGENGPEDGAPASPVTIETAAVA